MFRFICISILLLNSILSFGFSNKLTKKDSVGVTKVNGKLHVRYMISPGETIYRISTTYKVPISDLIDTNPELEFGLKTGQVINIPLNLNVHDKIEKPEERILQTPVPKPSLQQTDSTTEKGIVHTVQLGETFFSLSQKYKITVDELLKMNNVGLKAGQKIIIQPKVKTEEQAKQIEIKKQEPKKEPLFFGKPEPDEDFSTPATPLEYNNSKLHLLVIPFDPYLYFSDADDEIAATSKLQRTKVRQAFRRRLTALLDPKGYETINLLGGKARDSITDLNKIYSSVTYSYQDILNSPYNTRIEKQPEKGLGKEKNTGNSVIDAPTQTSRASLAKDPQKYFGVKINNPDFYNYFNNKYKIDYYLFVNQFEVKTNYEHCLDRATMNYERGFITHFSIFDKTGKQIAGNRIYTDYNSNTNNISKILADNMQKVADQIISDLPSAK